MARDEWTFEVEVPAGASDAERERLEDEAIFRKVDADTDDMLKGLN